MGGLGSNCAACIVVESLDSDGSYVLKGHQNFLVAGPRACITKISEATSSGHSHGNKGLLAVIHGRTLPGSHMHINDRYKRVCRNRHAVL